LHPHFSGYNAPNNLFGGGRDEFGEEGFLSSNSYSASLRVPKMRGALSGQQVGVRIFLLEPISLHGLCPTQSQRIFSRHRGDSQFASQEIIPYGTVKSGRSFHSGRLQRESRLSHLPRFRLLPHSHRHQTLSRREAVSGHRKRTLRPGLNNHRPVPLIFSVGQVQKDKGGHQPSYPPVPDHYFITL